jgi:predicted ABC-type sugar transport system permease subunit
MQPLVSAIHLAFYILNVGIPDSVGSSMRMADVISEMSALTTNITFSHLRTS